MHHLGCTSCHSKEMYWDVTVMKLSVVLEVHPSVARPMHPVLDNFDNSLQGLFI